MNRRTLIKVAIAGFATALSAPRAFARTIVAAVSPYVRPAWVPDGYHECAGQALNYGGDSTIRNLPDLRPRPEVFPAIGDGHPALLVRHVIEEKTGIIRAMAVPRENLPS